MIHGALALSFGSGFIGYPWMRVYKRLTTGEEDNVHHWYLVMLQYGSSAQARSLATLPPLSPIPPSGGPA